MDMGDATQASLPPDAAVRDVIRLAHHAGARNWVPSTSGNFSVRIDATSCAVTASGGDKGALTADGVIRVGLSDPRHPRASAEAPLHYMLYRMSPDIGAVTHVHAQSAVLASLKLATGGKVRLEGLEMLKALRGFATHEAALDVPVFDNDQDMDGLSTRVEKALAAPGPHWGFLLAGHGIYAWGRDTDEALRHLDAFDYLFSLSLKMKGIPV
jgi:methylthioribulose-1-phosphate dehydratase